MHSSVDTVCALVPFPFPTSTLPPGLGTLTQSQTVAVLATVLCSTPSRAIHLHVPVQYGRTLVTGFGSLYGMPVGVVANNGALGLFWCWLFSFHQFTPPLLACASAALHRLPPLASCAPHLPPTL